MKASYWQWMSVVKKRLSTAKACWNIFVHLGRKIRRRNDLITSGGHHIQLNASEQMQVTSDF